MNNALATNEGEKTHGFRPWLSLLFMKNLQTQRLKDRGAVGVQHRAEENEGTGFYGETFSDITPASISDLKDNCEYGLSAVLCCWEFLRLKKNVYMMFKPTLVNCKSTRWHDLRSPRSWRMLFKTQNPAKPFHDPSRTKRLTLN